VGFWAFLGYHIPYMYRYIREIQKHHKKLFTKKTTIFLIAFLGVKIVAIKNGSSQALKNKFQKTLSKCLNKKIDQKITFLGDSQRGSPKHP
jgi:hypothetical protein